MVNYRRARVPGAAYFFTVTLNNRESDLLVKRIDLLRSAFRTIRKQKPFRIDASLYCQTSAQLWICLRRRVEPRASVPPPFAGEGQGRGV